MMDLIAGSPNLTTADARPFYTCWKGSTVSLFKRLHRRTKRRQYKQYMKTGRIEDFNRSQRLMTNYDFD